MAYLDGLSVWPPNEAIPRDSLLNSPDNCCCHQPHPLWSHFSGLVNSLECVSNLDSQLGLVLSSRALSLSHTICEQPFNPVWAPSDN